MTLNALGLLLTAALVIAVRLGDAWSYRRRVRARLLLLITTDYCRGRELPWGKQEARRRLTPTPGQVVE